MQDLFSDRKVIKIKKKKWLKFSFTINQLHYLDLIGIKYEMDPILC